MAALIELSGVSKSFGGAPVLREIDLSVQEGEFLSIIGYSGAGKTTLISLIAGLIPPDAGSVTLAGKAVTGPGPDRGIVFQNYSLLPWLTVEENVGLAVDEVFPSWSAAERRGHVARHVTMVKLGHAARKLPRELSGGMRQRVAVARALAMEPRVLLLDEPLSALDALTRATLQDEISEIWQRSRTTVIWITNDPDEALLMADRVIPLTPGPGATLGPSMPIALERPRDRRTINHDPAFKAARAELVNWLLDAKKRAAPSVVRQVSLPDILPEDLNTVNSLQFLSRRGPRRRSDLQKETVEVLS